MRANRLWTYLPGKRLTRRQLYRLAIRLFRFFCLAEVEQRQRQKDSPVES